MSSSWVRHDPAKATVTLQIHAQPNARTTAAAGLHGDALKVRIAAPATDGRANSALLTWLASALDIPRNSLSLKSGVTARRKVIEIRPADGLLVMRILALIK